MLFQMRIAVGIFWTCQLCVCMDFTEFVQWCNVSSGWIPYDSAKETCFNCHEETKIITNSDGTQKEVCCYDGAQYILAKRQDCAYWPRNEIGRQCKNGNYFFDAEQCNGRNDCGDGSDESICDDCLPDTSQGPPKFQCTLVTFQQCFSISKVCDGQKDCLLGDDEINCAYHGGRCEGFLCQRFKECISKDQVCDGVKNCLDGSDEYECKLGQGGRYFCNGSNSDTFIDATRVCDGHADCPNATEEIYCHTWSPWNKWSDCNCTNSKRTRTCINSTLEASPGNCGQDPDTDIQSCECVSTTPFSTESTTSIGTGTVIAMEWIIIIALASAILLFSLLGIIYGAWYNKKAKEAMEKQAEVVANIYNQSTLSLSPPPPLTAASERQFEFPRATIQPSATVVSRAISGRQNEPLPPAPFGIPNHTYESIDEINRRRNMERIDPYAQSAGTSVFQNSESENDEGGETIVMTYSTSGNSISGASEQYVKTPPPTPQQEKKVDNEGYLVPSQYSKKYRQDVPDSKLNVAYAKVKSPVKPARSKLLKPSMRQSHSEELLSNALKMENSSSDQYTTMRSFSADGVFNGPPTARPRQLIGESVKLRDKTPAYYMQKDRPVRRVRSLGSLLEQTTTKEASEAQYSTMRSPEKTIRSTPESSNLDDT